MELSKQELSCVNGGGISWGIIAGIGAAITYLIGVISGYTNPSRCSN